eukprot:TRINITY_DN15875_c0_g1_i1.p1 TRINITY_DN15875_c0_g1~~TRINITY_DN15875_c0_g1_i1.p1  ORF type:complete len:106 (-),score=21.46 TRINITY_DN15875_c0_g1_i1:106-423(-)
MESISRDCLLLIFSYITSRSDWLNIKLVSKKWNAVGFLAYNPIKLNILQKLMNFDRPESTIVGLLQDRRVEPSWNLMIWACQRNYKNLVQHLLKDDPKGQKSRSK